MQVEPGRSVAFIIQYRISDYRVMRQLVSRYQWRSLGTLGPGYSHSRSQIVTARAVASYGVDVVQQLMDIISAVLVYTKYEHAA